jgi:hypothetical protein
MMAYSEFFRSAATGHDPYPYQRRLAEADPLPQLLDIPTGAGNTASVILARRCFLGNQALPSAFSEFVRRNLLALTAG